MYVGGYIKGNVGDGEGEAISRSTTLPICRGMFCGRPRIASGVLFERDVGEAGEL